MLLRKKALISSICSGLLAEAVLWASQGKGGKISPDATGASPSANLNVLIQYSAIPGQPQVNLMKGGL